MMKCDLSFLFIECVERKSSAKTVKKNNMLRDSECLLKTTRFIQDSFRHSASYKYLEIGCWFLLSPKTKEPPIHPVSLPPEIVLPRDLISLPSSKNR